MSSDRNPENILGDIMSECPRCKVLEQQVAALKHRIASLNHIISDMSGPASIELENPYEDEHPLVRGWGEDK